MDPKANLHFDINQTPDDLRLRLAQSSIVGVAQHYFTKDFSNTTTFLMTRKLMLLQCTWKETLDFYSWLSADHQITFWEELVNALTTNFGPAKFQNPDEYLCSIKQNGSVQEYRLEFVKRSSRVSNWPGHCLLGVFLNGLKEELRADVRIHKPRTVYNAMSLALEFESKIDYTRFGQNPKPNATTKTSSTINTPTETPSCIYPLRISDEGNQSRFTKALCFRSVLGIAINQELSNGSTHNFILDKLVNDLQLISQPITAFGVQIGDGNIIICNRMCKDVSLKLSNLLIIQDFYPFALGGDDVVLGIQLLATLSTVQANWAENSMIFTVNGQEHKLRGLKQATHNSTTCHHLAIKPFEEQLILGQIRLHLIDLRTSRFSRREAMI
ncbi:hypothetical protein E3N88_29197 [Mikania micrantha]|uniref:Retrotransposon gag domain-containing protein n=1 Tax=Mikania micrantha TaxID=192012 RepID=A0A5N6ML12_9ASTR|nr:hypothetical protein E3N88_29197 [Mikania micrantha]